MSFILKKVAPIGEERERELLKEASSHPYAQRDGTELAAHVFSPPQDSPAPAAGRPALVFFHGGFWDAAMATQFAPHCLHFAQRGAVCVAVETRVQSRHGSGPLEAIEDAREAIRWLRRESARLGVDPERITAVGAAGGALLALLCAMPKAKALPPVDGVSCTPQALVLFSALLRTLGKNSPVEGRFPDKRSAKSHQPASLLRTKLPPMLFLHGKSDRITPHEEVRRFRRGLRWRRNKAEWVDFSKADHSFFNFNVSPTHFEHCLGCIEDFLLRRNLLDPPPPDPQDPADS